MISLLVDTCTSYVVIGLLRENEIIDQRIELNDKDLSTNFVPLVEELLTKNSKKPTDIDTIFVAVGPGSFTGIRVGVTFAKVMAWSLNIKIIPFSSLELLASTSSENIVVPLIDARRGYVFGGIYDQNLNCIMDDKYVLLDELLEKLKIYNNPIFISTDSFNFTTILPDVDIRKVVSKHLNDEGVNPHNLNPNYLKKTEAEEKLNGE